MAVSLPRCRHKKSPELSRMAPHPRGAGTERHVYRHDPRGDRNGTISTSNAIRANAIDRQDKRETEADGRDEFLRQLLRRSGWKVTAEVVRAARAELGIPRST